MVDDFSFKSKKTLKTLEKTLAINLDSSKYGTLAEIGAGQEVARYFFQAGGAAGTIAKTMSAYDMKFSDAIYGVEEDGRYVSLSRLEKMVRREYDLVVERIADSRPKDSTFFSFADTVAAQGYKKRKVCHGWMGIRLQLTPLGPPHEIRIHVRMHDNSMREQQLVLGILGVNLIYASFFYHRNPGRFIDSLLDNIDRGRLEIDYIEFLGPEFEVFDQRMLALRLVEAGLTQVVVFDKNGHLLQPADILYKKEMVLIHLTSEDPIDSDAINTMKDKLLGQIEDGRKPNPNSRSHGLEVVSHLSIRSFKRHQSSYPQGLLHRVDELRQTNCACVVTNYRFFADMRDYANSYTDEKVRVLIDQKSLEYIFDEDSHQYDGEGILQALGRLFRNGTVLYYYNPGEKPLNIRPQMRSLFTYMTDSNYIIPLID